MGIIESFFAPSPFVQLHEHSKKVHECVELIRPLLDALLAEDYQKIDDLQNEMSLKEYEADQIKTTMRDKIADMYFLSVRREDLSRFLAYQDDIADAAEDFSVVLSLRKTRIPDELKAPLMDFANQVILVSERLLTLESEISPLAEAAFSGQEAQNVLKSIEEICHEEWKADRLERKFARGIYAMEKQLDPITVLFLDRYCQVLSAVANHAERTAKYLRLIIRKK